MSTPDQITSGTYELLATQLDVPTSKIGEPFAYRRYRAGDYVELDVAEARRLVLAGAVGEPGARQRAAAQAARAVYEAALANLPAELRAEIGVQAGQQSGAPTDEALTEAAAAAAERTADSAPAGAESADRPKQVEAKGKWVAFAIAQGMDPAEAAGMNKDDLIAAFPKGSDDEPPAGGQGDGAGGGDPATAGQ